MSTWEMHHGVVTIDCRYIRPGHAAAFLLPEPSGAAFIENNTAHAVPHLLEALHAEGLSPEQVRYAIITHLHLDHAGGTSALLAACPNAAVYCHPRAVRHLADPSRLIAGAKAVYGAAQFDALYGRIEPIPEARIHAVEDGEQLGVGPYTLTFLHTPGHAKHHIAIHDARTKGVFTGDIFGIMSTHPARGPALVFSTAPTDFDPPAARDSIRRIRQTGAERLFLTHFGAVENLDRAEAQIRASLDDFEAILERARASALEGEALTAQCEANVRAALERFLPQWGAPAEPDDWDWLEDDIRINAQGLAYAAQKTR